VTLEMSEKQLGKDILKSDKSCISDPKFRNIELDRTALRVQFAISDFGYEMQDSSDFKILRRWSAR